VDYTRVNEYGMQLSEEALAALDAKTPGEFTTSGGSTIQPPTGAAPTADEDDGNDDVDDEEENDEEDGTGVAENKEGMRRRKRGKE
jgi:hypothetical protein